MAKIPPQHHIIDAVAVFRIALLITFSQISILPISSAE